MTNPSPDYIELNNQIDAMLSSEDTLQAALNSDNPLLQAAARMANNSHPLLPLAVKQAILTNISSLSVNPASTASLLKPDFTGWIARIAAILVVAVVIGLAAQPASAGSLPGDVLYPIKLTFEQLELGFAGTAEAKATVHLNHAEERLNEIEQLPPDSKFLATTLQSAMDSVQSASTIAWENGIFAQNIVLQEQSQSAIIRIEEGLNAGIIPDDVLASVQLSLNVVRLQLPAPATTEITPESTETITEVLPESTDEALEATPELIENTNSVESSPDYIAVTPFTMYVHPDGRVNMHDGAGTDFAVSATANQNSPVTVLGQNVTGDWYFIRLSNGTVGWISVALLDDTSGQSTDGNGNGNGNGNSNGNANSNSSGNSNGNGRGN